MSPAPVVGSFIESFTVDASIWVAAFDRGDPYHQEAADFLGEAARRGSPLHAPRLLLLEVRCAIARRTRDAAAGARAEAVLRTAPFLQLHPVDERLLDAAGEAGSTQHLRSADALYAACSALQRAPLVSFDAELITRANAIPPHRAFSASDRAV